jgi:hypothetical protein
MSNDLVGSFSFCQQMLPKVVSYSSPVAARESTKKEKDPLLLCSQVGQHIPENVFYQ